MARKENLKTLAKRQKEAGKPKARRRKKAPRKAPEDNQNKNGSLWTKRGNAPLSGIRQACPEGYSLADCTDNTPPAEPFTGVLVIIGSKDEDDGLPVVRLRLDRYWKAATLKSVAVTDRRLPVFGMDPSNVFIRRKAIRPKPAKKEKADK